MSSNSFFIQGFDSKTYAQVFKELLNTKNLEKIIISVAFVKEDGVNLIEQELKSVSKKVTIYSGIRNNITSYQGLLKLLRMGVTVFIVDTANRGRIFHPKVYYGRARESAQIIVGSGNFTLGGFNNNIEAGLISNFNLKISEDAILVKGIENQFERLKTEYPDNILRIKNESDLISLRDSGRLLDEEEVPPPSPAITTRIPTRDNIPSIKLTVGLLRPSIKPAKKPIGKYMNKKRERLITIPLQIYSNLELVWESKPLTQRDLNIPNKQNTHPTGSINLDKGQLEEQIDHRHYFRDIVFPNLKWTKKSNTVEEARARFQLVVKSIYYGEFYLRIGHTFNKTGTSYRQFNAMTRLSWGDAQRFIANKDFIGRNILLYRDRQFPSRFLLEID